MENEFYRVAVDPKTGALKSIYDKEAGRELVDAESEYGLGEVIYVSGGEGSYAVQSDLRGLPAPKFVYHRPTATGLKTDSVIRLDKIASDHTDTHYRPYR
jgi:hypothetical protein